MATVPAVGAGARVSEPPAASTRSTCDVEADVALAQPVRDLRVVDAHAVVGHHEPGVPVGQCQVDGDVRGLSVFDDVAQQLAGGPVEQPVDRRAVVGRPSVQVELGGEPATGGGRRDQVAQRGGQTGALQDRRMQLRHRRSQEPRRLQQCFLQPVEGFGCAGVAGLVEVLAGREHVLQRAVVQLLGERPPLAPFQVGQLGEQIGPGPHQPADRLHPRALDPRQRHTRRPDARHHERAKQQ